MSDFAKELEGFHENVADCFHRSKSRDNFLRYMSGQFSQLERKSIEPIAIAMEGGKIRAMQHFVSDAPLDDGDIEQKYHSLVNEDLGHPDGAIIFDESGFVKKGNNSIGVAKQYRGTVCNVENCQVGVFAAYTSALRDKCKLPKKVTFQTKPQLAAEILTYIAEQKQIPFRYFLGGCPRIGIFSQIEAFRKNEHRHIVTIPSIIFPKQRRVGKKGILGQPPSQFGIHK